jgi:hypothetical protein
MMVDTDDERIRKAVEYTEILRAPRQSLYTFGTTNIYYYLVTEPAYSELVDTGTETVVREGRVLAERPKIVTTYYLAGLEGFSDDARRYFESLIHEYGPNVPGLLYAYKNEPRELNIVSGHWLSVVDKINAEIDQRNDPLAAIIKGLDELWDVALIRFIFEMTRRSLSDNIGQMGARGLLDVDSRGVPADVRLRIERLFLQVSHREISPETLKEELDRWGLFDEYEDRFLNIFRR